MVITGRAEETLRALPRRSAMARIAIRSDIAELTQVAALFTQLGTQLGHIDVLFVNAGIGAFQPIEKVTEQDWDNIHGINLKGVFFTVQQALPLLRQGSAIVLTGSIGALKGIPTGSVYAASKAGLRALGRCLPPNWSARVFA